MIGGPSKWRSWVDTGLWGPKPQKASSCPQRTALAPGSSHPAPWSPSCHWRAGAETAHRSHGCQRVEGARAAAADARGVPLAWGRPLSAPRCPPPPPPTCPPCRGSRRPLSESQIALRFSTARKLAVDVVVARGGKAVLAWAQLERRSGSDRERLQRSVGMGQATQSKGLGFVLRTWSQRGFGSQ